MENSIYSIGNKVICTADYHANESLWMKAKENLFNMPKKQQPLTVKKVIFSQNDNSYFLQFEEIDNPTVNGQEVCFYELNFAPAHTIKSSMEFSERVMEGLEDKINKGTYVEMNRRNDVGKCKVSKIMPYLILISKNYNLNLSRNSGYRIATNIFKRSLKLN